MSLEQSAITPLLWKDLWLWSVGTGIGALMLCVDIYTITGVGVALIIATVCLALMRWVGPWEIDRPKQTKQGTLPLWIIILATTPTHLSQLSGNRGIGAIGLLMLLVLMALCTMHDLPLVHARFPPLQNPDPPRTPGG